MVVVANTGESHEVGDAEGLPNLVSRLHASKVGLGAEPINPGVVDDEQASWCDHTGQHVVVEGKKGDVVGVIGEVEREPDVLHDDLGSGLGVDSTGEHCIGDAPAALTSGAGFLWNGEKDALLESTGDECTLSVARASCDTKAREVDFRLGFCLENVDDATDCPGPRSHRGCGRVRAVEVVEVAETSAGGIVLLGDLVVVEHDGSNVTGDGDADTANADHGGEWCGAIYRQGNAGVEGNGIPCVGNVDHECLSDESTLDNFWLSRESAQLDFLEELAYFITTAGPRSLGVHREAVNKLERVW